MSINLYQYLCEKVGSEEVVKIRRFFLDVVQHVMDGHKKFSVIISGSKREGLDMPGSDVDIMIVLRDFPVITYLEEGKPITSYSLIAETDNASPGFASLRIPKSGVFNNLTETVGEKLFLSNAKFKSYCQMAILGRKIFDFHGPCLVPPLDDFDFAYCLKSEYWPSVANHWIHRPRISGWPSSELVSEIVESGIIFVPIGSKFGSETDNPMEWRISFSEAEKLLVHSFNHTQLLTYAMLKILLKETLKKKDDCATILCSYHLKTILFWVIEEEEINKWSSINMLQCFKLCVNKLLYFITTQFCPHYFIPQSNLFEGKITDERKEKLIRLLVTVLGNIVNFFFESDSLNGFLTYKVHSAPFNLQSRDYLVDWGVFPLLFLVKHVRVGEFTLARFGKLFSQRWYKLEKQIIDIVFAYFCHSKCYYTEEYRVRLFHKRKRTFRYTTFNNMQALALLGTNFGISSWLKFAIILFLHDGQMKKSLIILNYVLSECRKNKILIGISGKIDRCVKSLHSLDLSLVQRHKLTFLYDLHGNDTENPYVHSTEIYPFINIMKLFDIMDVINSIISVDTTNDFLESIKLVYEYPHGSTIIICCMYVRGPQ